MKNSLVYAVLLASILSSSGSYIIAKEISYEDPFFEVACEDCVVAPATLADIEDSQVPKPEKQEFFDEGPNRVPAKKDFLKVVCGDSVHELTAKVKFEGFYGKNINLFNNANPQDQIIIPSKLTFDLNWLYHYGMQTFGRRAIDFKATLRTKGTFGDPETIAATTQSTIKDLDAVIGSHQHQITRHIVWFRELWLDMCLNDALHIPFNNEHRFTIGLFPFSLGWGISLGSAYAVDPDFIGYYSPNAVDQYAPGFRFYGDFVKDCVGYDFYAAITQNKSDTFNNTNAQILDQIIGKRNNPVRGFGKINYILATRLRLQPYKDECNSIYIEPYALYNDEREQKLEVIGDSNGKLGTFGLAFDATFGNFEIGFDTAFNVGRQKVLPLDRNIVQHEVRTGSVVEVYSHVKALRTPVAPDVAGKKALFTDGNKNAVNNAPQAVDLNGQPINAGLVNADDRFRAGYKNTYKGKMFVGEMAYNFSCFGNMQMAVTAGFATGDENPNKPLEDPNDAQVDGDYRGFIGLQETYSGKRVKSAFVLSGSGNLPRVLSFPSDDVDEQFASTVSRFNNLIFVGGGLALKDVCLVARPWNISSYVWAFWQEHRTKFFDQSTNESSPNKYARRYLGTEINLFLDTVWLDDLKFFITTGIFVPGSHYKDIKGKPITKDQQKFLAAQNDTGFNPNRPLLGDDTAFFINVGLEYKF